MYNYRIIIIIIHTCFIKTLYHYSVLADHDNIQDNYVIIYIISMLYIYKLYIYIII